MNAPENIWIILYIVEYFATVLLCLYTGHTVGLIKGRRKGRSEGVHLACDEFRKTIDSFTDEELNDFSDKVPGIPKIGDTVYSILPKERLDQPDRPDEYVIEPWIIYGAGITRDGDIVVMSWDLEIFVLDDETDGLSFSTLEKAQQHLKKIQELRNEK